MEKIFDATIVNKREVAESTYELTFEINNGNFSFIPGQYIWVVLNELKYPDEHGNRHCFSIVSEFRDEKNRIRCVFRDSDSGFKKSLIGRLRI
ncbi:MAG: hypothetical protein Q8L36_00615 [bacterium]|nr:hypothetical protein [bacterium]